MQNFIIALKNEIKIALSQRMFLEVGEMKNKDVKAGETDNGKVVIKPAWCKGCGICVAFCPTKALALENDKVVMPDVDKCIQCGMCELRCPDYAIYVGRKKNEKQG